MASDLGLYNTNPEEYSLQLEEVARVELERAVKTYQAKTAPKPKSKGIKLKKSLEKFKNKFRLSTGLASKDKETLSDDVMKNLELAQVSSRSPTLSSTHFTDTNSSTSELSDPVPSGFVAGLDEILDYDFHCRRIGLENFYLNEQNQTLANELKLVQDTLFSLRKILQQKVDNIERLNDAIKGSMN